MTTRPLTDDLFSRDDQARPRFSWPLELLKRPAQALGRRLSATQNCNDLAALDPHLLADIGLRRSLVHPACLVPSPED
jgi:uncharacterized protein YjiS (DUF1127 family)